MREMCSKIDDAFREYCFKDIERHVEFCRTHGLMDDNNDLLLEVFRENFNKTEPEWALGLSAAVSAASHFATINEYLGQTEKAKQYLWLGSHEWNYRDIDYPYETGDRHILKMKNLTDRMIRADDLVLQQLPAAICCERVGNRERANQLFGWVAQLRGTSDEEYEEFITSFAELKSYYEVWGRRTERAFALASLGRWGEALAEAKGAQRWVEKGPRPIGNHSWRDYFWLLRALEPLIEYRLDPSEKNKAAAREGLRPSILKSEDHDRTLFLLFYLFNLRAKFPELD
jgi:hypothetical protein